MARLLTVTATEGHVQIIKLLGYNRAVTNNVNFREETFRYIKLDQYLGCTLVKDEVEIFLQRYKPPNGVGDANKDLFRQKKGTKN